MSNLRLIKDTSATTGISSFAITNIFSDDYDIYKIVVTNGQSGGAASDVNFRFLDAFSMPISASEYDTGTLAMKTGSSFVQETYTNQNLMKFGAGFVLRTPSASNTGAVIYVYSPTNSSSYTFSMVQAMDEDYSRKGIGVLTQLSKVTGISFIPNNSSATITTLNVKCYGVRTS